MNTIMLNNNWKVLEAPMRWDKSYAAVVADKKEGWMPCDLPADVRMPLLESGKIKEPLQSDNCRESEWIENRSWWFEKRFSGSEVDWNMGIIELVLEGLDTRSDIFINGHYLGTHRSVHYPFVHDVKNYLCQDGIHPNEAGYRLLSAAVLDAAQADPAMPWRSQQKEA